MSVPELPQQANLGTLPNDDVVTETHASTTPHESVSAKVISRGQRNIKIQKWAVTVALIGVK